MKTKVPVWVALLLINIVLVTWGFVIFWPALMIIPPVVTVIAVIIQKIVKRR